LYDEGTGATTVAVALQGSGSVTLVNGTLTRTVLPVANTLNASILQVTFRVDYTYGSKPYSYQITTMRAYDD
jgi:Asp-tRNA(Asn)/Glu-tRNA(Gln) amidotransferase B subunit